MQGADDRHFRQCPVNALAAGISECEIIHVVFWRACGVSDPLSMAIPALSHCGFSLTLLVHAANRSGQEPTTRLG